MMRSALIRLVQTCGDQLSSAFKLFSRLVKLMVPERDAYKLIKEHPTVFTVLHYSDFTVISDKENAQFKYEPESKLCTRKTVRGKVIAFPISLSDFSCAGIMPKAYCCCCLGFRASKRTSVSQSVSQSSISQSVSQPVSEPVSQSVSQSVNQ